MQDLWLLQRKYLAIRNQLLSLSLTMIKVSCWCKFYWLCKNFKVLLMRGNTRLSSQRKMICQILIIIINDFLSYLLSYFVAYFIFQQDEWEKVNETKYSFSKMKTIWKIHFCRFTWSNPFFHMTRIRSMVWPSGTKNI